MLSLARLLCDSLDPSHPPSLVRLRSFFFGWGGDPSGTFPRPRCRVVHGNHSSSRWKIFEGLSSNSARRRSLGSIWCPEVDPYCNHANEAPNVPIFPPTYVIREVPPSIGYWLVVMSIYNSKTDKLPSQAAQSLLEPIPSGISLFEKVVRFHSSLFDGYGVMTVPTPPPLVGLTHRPFCFRILLGVEEALWLAGASLPHHSQCPTPSFRGLSKKDPQSVPPQNFSLIKAPTI